MEWEVNWGGGHHWSLALVYKRPVDKAGEFEPGLAGL